MRPDLEKAGILDEPGVFVDMSRPADVFIPDLANAENESFSRVALDIKIINALGQSHYEESLESSTLAAENYRETANNRADVRARCAARGIRYEPVVFTTQGGCDKRSEALLSQIADIVARTERQETGVVKAELMQAISMSIAKSVAKAVIRRMPPVQKQPNQQDAMIAELHALSEPMQEDG